MNNENANKKYFPNLVESWILVFLLCIPIALLSIIIKEILNKFGTDKDLSQLVSYIVLIGGAIAVGFAIKKKRKNKPLIKYKSKVSPIIYLILIPATVGLSIATDYLSSIILPEIPEKWQEIFENMINFNLPTILSIVVAAPILEEILCRGIICEGLSKNGKATMAIFWSALIFAVIHLNPWQGLSAFVVGCFLGWIYLKTRSILPCIFIHFVNNGGAMLAYYISLKSGHDIDATSAEVLGISDLLLAGIGIAVFGICLFVLNKIQKKRVD